MSENLPVNERPRQDNPTRVSGIAWGGIALIGIGVVFLLREMNLLPFEFNWWALFILLPALAIYYRAWQMYRATERVDRRLRTMLVGATAMFIVALIFLLDLSWGIVWPIFIILAGVMALANASK